MDRTRSRGEYVGRLVKASLEHLTGTFEVRSGRRRRTIHLQRGRPVWSEGEEGTATTDVVSLEAAIGEPLAWEPSEVIFEEHRTVPVEALKGDETDDLSMRRALWQGVERHLPLTDVLPSVIDPAGGPVQPTLGLWTALEELEVGHPYSNLPEALGSGATVEELLARIPDRSGSLMKLIWFLERAELLERPSAARSRRKTEPRGGVPPHRPTPLQNVSGPAAPPKAVARPERPDASPDFSWWKGADGSTPGGGVTPNAPSDEVGPVEPEAPQRQGAAGGLGPTHAREIAGVIQNAHRDRMGRDYYTFLGLPSKAPAEAVDRSCRQLMRRWKVFHGRADLPPRAKEQATELLASLQLVYRTLGRPERKVEYDRRVDRGSPPVVGRIRAASSSQIEQAAAASKSRGGAATVDLLAASREMEAGRWDRALAILHTLRMQNPSDPDVLAELGWCAHNHGSSETTAPEEYLRLAVTFDADHEKALEYLARLALHQDDTEGARGRLKRLTRLNPQNRWARRALRKLPEPKDP